MYKKGIGRKQRRSIEVITSKRTNKETLISDTSPQQKNKNKPNKPNKQTITTTRWWDHPSKKEADWLKGLHLRCAGARERDHLLVMYGAPERELLQSDCKIKEWTICDEKTVPHPPNLRSGFFFLCWGRGNDRRLTTTPPLLVPLPPPRFAAVKEQALQDVFKPASTIVEEVKMQNK